MRSLAAVFGKELRENFRDRRTLLSALLFGPLGAPLLFAVAINVSLERGRDHADRQLVLAVAGAEHAPNLIGFLRGHGLTVRPFAGDAAEAVRSRRERLVLEVPDGFGARLRRGEPAPVRVYADGADTATAADRDRTSALIAGYAAEIAALRLEARGLSASLLQPIVVDAIDVSTPAARALLVLGMLSYFIVFATLMGGLYVAIDATAGERERGSLEPLLTLPVRRVELVGGKILAAAFFMSLSLALTLAAFSVSLKFVRLESLGMTANFGPTVALAVFALMLPFVLFGAAMMTLVAAFTKSYREAQSWLTVVLLLPTVPIMFAAIYQLEARASLMWIPSLAQHLLINALLRGDPPGTAFVLTASASTALLGLVLAAAAVQLYRRERILG